MQQLYSQLDLRCMTDWTTAFGCLVRKPGGLVRVGGRSGRGIGRVGRNDKEGNEQDAEEPACDGEGGKRHLDPRLLGLG